MNAQKKALHIDIPVKLAEVKVVFSIASLSFEGDLPASLFHLQLIVNDISDWNANGDLNESEARNAAPWYCIFKLPI